MLLNRKVEGARCNRPYPSFNFEKICFTYRCTYSAVDQPHGPAESVWFGSSFPTIGTLPLVSVSANRAKLEPVFQA